MMTLRVRVLSLFLPFSGTPAYPFTGHVVGVIDGDSIGAIHNRKAQRIRLEHLDCPEESQAFGTRATPAIANLLFAKSVTVESHGHDKYGRSIGDIFLSDGSHVNHELMTERWCWGHRKHASEDLILAAFETAARVAKKGL